MKSGSGLEAISLNRFFVTALLSLACLSTLPALAQASGSAEPSVTLSVGANPVPGNVPVTAMVQPYIGSTKIPTGTITFLDFATVLNPGGTALTPPGGVSSQTFAAAIGTLDPGLAVVAQGAITGDFDGDGKPDLLIYGTANASASTEVQVFLTSNAGSAHFRAVAPQTLAIPFINFPTPATLYSDKDTHLDLLIGNVVAYGNGDGTFSNPGVLPILAEGFQQSYIVEGLTGSGQFLVAVNAPPSPIPTSGTVQYTFTVFSYDFGTPISLGHFALAGPIQMGGSCCALLNVFGLSFADVNGDGNIDVISESNSVSDGNVSAAVNFNVMLNNGNGTFGAPKPIDTSTLNNLQGGAVAFGDIDGDGKNDLVLAYADYRGQNYVAAALGNGDGTFGTFSQLLLINYLTASIHNPQVQLTDFDGDGKLDAIVGSGEVALGKGDGTFALSTPLFAQPANPQTPLNYPLVQIPIDANAAESLVYLNPTSGANAVFTPQNAATVKATLALAAGSHSITAQYSGDSTYAASLTTENVSVASVPPTIGITSSATTIYATQSITFTATLSDPTITGSLTFVDISKNDDNPLDPMAGTTESTLGTGTIANGVATLTTKLLVGGTHTILAVYGADIYAPIAQAQLTETVNVPFAVNVSGTGVSLTASSGHTATVTLPVQALAGFTGQVTFGCQGQPICNFSPATVDLSGTGTTNVTLTVTAAAVTATNTANTRFGSMALACGLPLFALLGFARGGRRRILLLVFGTALCVIPFTGCGGGNSSLPPSSSRLDAGSYLFSITAASGQNVLVLQGTLTVK